MTPERWQRIKALLESALERPRSDRASFLREACAADSSLYSQVEALIASHDQAGNFLEAPAFELLAESLDQSQSMIGRDLGPYRVVRRLGVGGMGEVYLAEDTRLGRKVALKLLLAHFTLDQERVRRFQQEARAASALNVPNILTIHEIGQVGSRHFIVMELIEGETLRQHLSKAPITISEALDLAIQIASALSAAHAAAIVHRDIKPDNVMVRADGIVKILDFGLAKLTEPKSGEQEAEQLVNTKQGMVMGTAHYMSPEQARGLPVDHRSDLWSLGIVLYEMIGSCVPFDGGTSSDVIAAILNREPMALAGHAPEVPVELEWIVKKALRKDREDRYQTAKDLLTDLRSLKNKLNFEEQLQRSHESGDNMAAVIRKSESRSGKKERPLHATQPQQVIDSLARTPARSRSPRRGITSLAILPLANTVDDPELDYFSDGITESIINTLAQLPKLRVVARSTVFRYKHQQIDPLEVGRLLDVQAVLTGRVRQIADRLIISTELIDVANDSQLWGEHYNRNLSDIFAVQEEIAREIAEKLQLKLNRKEKARLGKRHTHKVEAYQAYLKGRYHWNKRTAESLNKAVEYFRHAIDHDPAYASAYAGLSDSYTLLVVREAMSPAEGFAKAKAAASRALEIDEEFAEAHASLGHAMLHNWEWGEGEKELKKAIHLNPGYASAHHWYSEHLTAVGRCDESIAELELAAGLDPLSLVISADLGRAFYYAREYDQVMKQEASTLEMDPNFWLSHINLGRAYIQTGNHAEAISELKKAGELSVGNTEALSFLGFAYAAAGKEDDARRTLHQLVEQSKRSYVPPYHLAIVHAGLRENDRAFERLEKAFEKHAVDLFTLKVEPMFDGLRSDQRFGELLRRVGLASSEHYQEPAEVSPNVGVKKTKAITQSKPAAMAVLPFRPISAESRDEILELGMADALITRLSDINQIIVRPTSVVRKYMDLEQDSESAGRELAVEFVLEGNIQRLGDRIRITVRLVKIEDGRSLWTGKFDEEFTDIFAVEDSISEKVTSALAVKLTGQDRERLKRRYTENTAAYHLYLKGRYYWNKRTEQALNKAIECFDQALAIDPNYALPHAGVADCYTKLGDVGVTAMLPRDAFARARAAALRALKIDNSLADVHASLGHIDMHQFRWADAERDFKRAIELNPNYATAHHWYAYYMAFNQRFDEALAKIEVALKLDPLSLPIADSVGEFLYFARRYDEAIAQLHKTLEMEPTFIASHIHLGRAYEQRGMFSEAEKQFVEARQIAGESIDSLAALGHSYAMSGNTGAALDVLAELTELSKERYVSPYDIALIHTALRSTEEAFSCLEKAYDECAEWMIYMNVDPRLDPIRCDARFRNLISRIGFAPTDSFDA